MKPGGVEHRGARRARVGHGVEAHQDVRQAEQAEHQREAERHGVERIGDQAAGLERRLAVALGDRGVETRRREVELREHQDGQHRHAEQQQHRLDDLHPGRRDHAAEEHVGEHHDADAGHRPLVGMPNIRRIRFPAPTICAIV